MGTPCALDTNKPPHCDELDTWLTERLEAGNLSDEVIEEITSDKVARCTTCVGCIFDKKNIVEVQSV